MAMSKGQIKIKAILDDANIIYKQEYSVPGLCSDNGIPLRFDFAVFDDDGEIDGFIEFQGEQHYRPVTKYGGKRGFYQQQYNDNKKRRYCALNGITLVEIRFDEYELLTYDLIYQRLYE